MGLEAVKMTEVTSIIADPAAFLEEAMGALSTQAVTDLLTVLPIVGDGEYAFERKNPAMGWREGKLHWYPVGGDRGNMGRIKLAGHPEFPVAERTVNAHEAIIELMRRRELVNSPTAPPPETPREAVTRYFHLPPLDKLPGFTQPILDRPPMKYARDLARKVRVRASSDKKTKEWSVIVEDDGIGQTPAKMHATLLSLGSSDKPDKPYLVGVFGQGGSSAYAASQVSWMISRRASDLLDGDADGVGWTVIKRITPSGRRDVYWAYLAAHPDGRVLSFPADGASKVEIEHGTKIAHIGYDFGRFDVARVLYQAMNHLLFNPVLPYELYTKESADVMYGNAYRLAKLTKQAGTDLDKRFEPTLVERK